MATGARETGLPVGAPDTVPVFRLPEHVFLPEAPAPYRIFEPRYREMIHYLLGLPESQRWLAIPRLAPGYEDDYEGSPRFLEIATVGRVAQCLGSADGTFHIVAGDGVRCRLEEVPSGHSFRMARPSPWPDEPERDPASLDASFDALLQVIAALVQTLGRSARGLLAIAQQRTDRVARVYRLGGLLIGTPDRRQEFLEARSLARRIDLVMNAAAVLLAAAGESGAGPPS